MDRRRFASLLGVGALAAVDRLAATAGASAAGLGELAKAFLRDEPLAPLPLGPPTALAPVKLEHWRAAKNAAWRWYERSELVFGEWRLTGMTTPVHRESGEPKTGVEGYLEESAAPAALRRASGAAMVDFCVATQGQPHGPLPTPARRGRHGRPPSRWLRGLSTEELRLWLAWLTPPEAGVSGMTFLEHLTRDHGFDLSRVAGLSVAEQTKLHGAAHHGY